MIAEQLICQSQDPVSILSMSVSLDGVPGSTDVICFP